MLASIAASLVLVAASGEVTPASDPEIKIEYNDEGDVSHTDAFNSILRAYRAPPQDRAALFEMVWFPEGSPQVASWTTLASTGETHVRRHIWDWAVQGGGGKRLNPQELETVRSLLFELPPSAQLPTRATLLLVRYSLNGRQQHRVYDRATAPEAIVKLNALLESRLQYGPLARGDLAQEWELPSPQMDWETNSSYQGSTPFTVIHDFEGPLGRSIILEPELAAKAPPIINFNSNRAPLNQALREFAALMDGNVYFSRGVYYIARKPLTDVLSQEQHVPAPTPEIKTACMSALAELESDDYDTRRLASPKLLAMGPGVLNIVSEHMATKRGDADLLVRLSSIEAALRARLSDGEPTVRLKIQLRKRVYFQTAPKNLGEAKEVLAKQLDTVPEIVVDEDLASKSVTVPQRKHLCGYAAVECIARSAGCRVQIKGNTIRFSKF